MALEINKNFLAQARKRAENKRNARKLKIGTIFANYVIYYGYASNTKFTKTTSIRLKFEVFVY